MVCVIAKLSPEATERLDALRKTVLPGERFSAPLHGHITLATYLPEDDEAFLRSCEEIIRETHSFTVHYEKLEVLSETSIIAAIPSKTEELVTLHRRIADRSGESLDRWTRGKDWIPHTTLVYDPDADLDAVCRAMRQHFVPFGTKISRIEFSRVEAAGYTILKSMDLA